MSSASLKKILVCAGAVFCFAFLGGCRQDMPDQPKFKPLAPTDFFGDGRSERPLVEHTVPRGAIADDALVIPKDSNAFPLPVTQELLNVAATATRFSVRPATVCRETEME